MIKLFFIKKNVIMRNFTLKSLLFCAAFTGLVSNGAQAQNITFTQASEDEANALNIKASDGVPLFVDFNNDGFMDIYSTGQTFEWLPTGEKDDNGGEKWDWKWYDGHFLTYNNGDGTYTTYDRTQTNGLPTTYGSGGSKAIDFNQDGYTDFIFLSCNRGWTGVAQNEVILVKNNGDGTFEVVKDEALASLKIDNRDYRPNQGQSLNCMSVADYNKDGYPDVLIQYEAQGQWERAVKLLKNVNGKHFEVVENPGFIPQCGGSVSFGDFNNDGWPDIVVTGWADVNNSIGLTDGGNQMHFYRNTKDGKFELATTDLDQDLTTAGKKWGFGDDAVLYVLDYDQDGKQDILCIGGIGNGSNGNKEHSKNGKRSLLLRNVSTGNSFAFEEYETNIYPGSGENTHMSELADFNGDGWVDYLGYGWNGDWVMSASSSTGSYDQFDINTQLGVPVWKEGYMTHGDINNDGLLDLATLNSNDRIGYNRNATANENVQKPNAPTDVNVTYDKEAKVATMTWTGSQTESGSKAFYNLYIKNEQTGKTFMIAPADIESGKQRAYTAFSTYTTPTTFTFENVEEGHYTLGVQAVTYSWQASEFTTVEVNTNPYSEVPASIDPEEGAVSEIGIVTLTASSKHAIFNANYNEDGSIDDINALNCELPYLLNKATDEKIHPMSIDFGEGYNNLQLWFFDESFQPITAPGEYELVIPQGLYCCPSNKEDWENFVVSGPMNKEMHYNYIIEEAEAGPNVNILGALPEPGEVETLSSIILAFDQPVYINTEIDAPSVTLNNRAFGSIKATLSAVEGEENQVLATFETEVSDMGMYMLDIPEMIVFNANGDWNAASNAQYMVKGKPVETTGYIPTGITPAEGEVTSLQNFVLAFDENSIAAPNIDTQEQAYLVNTGNEEEKVTASVNAGNEVYEINIVLAEEVKAKGTYTLVIPAKMIQSLKDMAGTGILDNSPELTYTFTVVDGQSINAILTNGQKADVYTIGGVLVKKAADREALKTLKKGLYIINGKNVLVK